MHRVNMAMCLAQAKDGPGGRRIPLSMVCRYVAGGRGRGVGTQLNGQRVPCVA